MSILIVVFPALIFLGLVIALCASAWGLLLAVKSLRLRQVPSFRSCLFHGALLLLVEVFFVQFLLTNGSLSPISAIFLCGLATILAIQRTMGLRCWKACQVAFMSSLFAVALQVAMAAPIALSVRWFVVVPFKIPAESMAPTLKPGDRILVDKLAYRWRPPRRWDVAVFRFPLDRRRPFVKRIVGLPGEMIEIRDGSILVNGVKPHIPASLANLQWQNHPQAPYGQAGQRIAIPRDSYFVLGDRSVSHDSRFWGFVPKRDIIGKAFYIFWPPEHEGEIK